MWAWAIIDKRNGQIVEEGFFYEKDARRVAEEMGENFEVDFLPL